MIYDPHNANCTLASVDFWSKGPPFRVAVGLTNILSVLGALLIICSYVGFKSLRNDARLILVHLSLMDLGVGLTNTIGNLIYFDRFYYNGSCSDFHFPKHDYINNLCIAQGFFAHLFTHSSILWTISLAVYIYFAIVQHRTPLAKMSLTASYFLCYGLPIALCTWLVLTKRFGYSPHNTGWCSILVISAEEKEPDIFVAILGYDLWITLAMLFTTVLYLAVQLFLKDKLKQSKKYLKNAKERFQEALHILDHKFLFIPLVFTLLSMWTCMVDLFYVYIRVHGVPRPMSITLTYLSAMGDSGQGFANAVLFVLFTKRVRRTVFNLRYWKAKLCGGQGEELDPLILDPEIASLRHVPGSAQDGTDGPECDSLDTDIFTPTRHSTTLSDSFRSLRAAPING